MRKAGFARRPGRDNPYDPGVWQVVGLVTVRTGDGLMFGRLETRVPQGVEARETSPSRLCGRQRRAATTVMSGNDDLR